jgi:hypothetical protein
MKRILGILLCGIFLTGTTVWGQYEQTPEEETQERYSTLSVSSNKSAQTLTTADTYYVITAFNAVGEENGVTGNHTTNVINVTTGGTYQAIINIDFEVTVSGDYTCAVFVDGAETSLVFTKTMSGENPTESASITDLVTIDAGEDVDFRCKSSVGTAGFIPYTIYFHLATVGGLGTGGSTPVLQPDSRVVLMHYITTSTIEAVPMPPIEGDVTRIDCETYAGTSFTIDVCVGDDRDGTCDIPLSDAPIVCDAAGGNACASGCDTTIDTDNDDMNPRDLVTIIITAVSGNPTAGMVYFTVTP